MSRSVRVTSSSLSPPLSVARMAVVIQNIVAAVIGLALVVYLAYALVHPERF